MTRAVSSTQPLTNDFPAFHSFTGSPLIVYVWSRQWTPTAEGVAQHSRSFTHSVNVSSFLQCSASILSQSFYYLLDFVLRVSVSCTSNF